MAVILIVEDEVFIRQHAEWMLEDLGHLALPAEDMEQALVHLTAPRRIDALFVDIRLNRLAHGGYEVANRALELQPHLRVLYTSGSQLTTEMSGQFVCGGRFLQKPYGVNHLALSIDQLLH